MIRAYYGLQVYGEYANNQYPGNHVFPQGTILYIDYGSIPMLEHKKWFTTAMESIDIDDVPRELRALQMILGNSRTM